MHQQLAESLDGMRELSAVTPETVTQARRGEVKGPDYDPADLRPGMQRDSKEISMERELGGITSVMFSYLSHLGISESLKEKLMNEVKKLLPKVEALGTQMSEFGTPLWDAYRNEYHRFLLPAVFSPPSLTPTLTLSIIKSF